jgi:hypothetical protein
MGGIALLTDETMADCMGFLKVLAMWTSSPCILLLKMTSSESKHIAHMREGMHW